MTRQDDPKACPNCGYVEPPYDLDQRLRDRGKTLLIQTPHSVWEQYRADGYTITEAIKEEWSYA